MLFNQDVIAYRAKPAKAYDKFEYYKNGGADEIIFVFHGSGVMESVFGKLPLSRRRLHCHSARNYLQAGAGQN